MTCLDSIKTPADRWGALIDTGLHVGDVVDVETDAGTVRRVVLGPSSQAHEYTHIVSAWKREFRFEPMVRVAPEGCPELWTDVALSRVLRLEEAVTR